MAPIASSSAAITPSAVPRTPSPRSRRSASQRMRSPPSCVTTPSACLAAANGGLRVLLPGHLVEPGNLAVQGYRCGHGAGENVLLANRPQGVFQFAHAAKTAACRIATARVASGVHLAFELDTCSLQEQARHLDEHPLDVCLA